MKRQIGRLFTILAIGFAVFGAAAVSAQDQPVRENNTISFNNFEFSFGLATNVNVIQYPGDPVDLSQPGGAQPPYTEFRLYNGIEAPDFALESVGSIRVFDTRELGGYVFANNQLVALQDILERRPDLTMYETVEDNLSAINLPFLPTFPAGQVLRARAHYLETEDLSGIAFVTAYAQDASPFVSTNFLYTFQGISSDGRYYVSAIFPLVTTLFDDQIPSDFSYETFIAGLTDYMIESIGRLNAGTPSDFVPALDAMDAIIQSFEIDSDD